MKNLTRIPPRVTPRTIINETTPLDDAVDRTFGEPVVLRPMKRADGGYREPIPDDSRQQVIARGIYDQTRGAVEATGGGAMHTQATVDTSLSIREEPLLQCQLRKGDHVYFPERDELHEVTFIHAEPGGRPDVHLVGLVEEE
jgi:hypothetical protein